MNDKKMVSSCSECENRCCQTGPGPWINKTPETYLENFGEVSSYNKQCSAFRTNGTCALWGTPELPMACRTWVCQQRKFTPREIATIKNVTEFECDHCGCEWIVRKTINADKELDKCEICGFEKIWDGSVKKKGLVRFKKEKE